MEEHELARLGLLLCSCARTEEEKRRLIYSRCKQCGHCILPTPPDFGEPPTERLAAEPQPAPIPGLVYYFAFDGSTDFTHKRRDGDTKDELVGID